MTDPERRVGRPTKLNRTILKRLIEMFALGASNADACRYAGISHDSLQRWLAARRAKLAVIEARDEGEYECSDAAMLAMAVIALCVVESFRDVPQVVEIAIAALVVWAVGLAIGNFTLPGSDDRPVPE